MARGGARPGAGRKPGSKNQSAVVIDMDGTRRPRAEFATPTDAPAVQYDEPDLPAPTLLEPPPELTGEAEQACWRRFAARAVRQRTLTDAEVPGFVELCQVFVMKEQIAAHIAKSKAGAATKSMGDLLRHYVKLGQRVDAQLARFKLTAFGKPSGAAPAVTPKANPWASLAK